MIEEVVLKTRECDGKKVYARYSEFYVGIEEPHRYYAEVPEGEDASGYAHSFSGRIKQDQTGLIYEIAHDVEDAPYTYTEVYPDPRYVTEFTIGSYTTSDSYCRVNFNKYPAYNAKTTYKKGDIVTTSSPEAKTWICVEDEVTGISPDVWGWDEYLPYIEVNEPVYKTMEELVEEGAWD